MPAKGGATSIPRALTIATSDSGGGAGIQADLKAFAAAGVYGTSAIVALTAQNTKEVTAVHELPSDFIRAQLHAVFDDIGVDAAKTGMLFSKAIVDTVADFLHQRRVPLVVDPVLIASSGAKLLLDDAVDTLVSRLFPLATVVTPNLNEAVALAGFDGTRRELAERLHELGAPAVIVTGGTARTRSTICSRTDGTSRSPSTARTSPRRTERAARTRPRSPRCSRRERRWRTPHVRPRASRRRRYGTGSSSSAPAKGPSTC